MNGQMRWDLYQAQQTEGDEVRKIRRHPEGSRTEVSAWVHVSPRSSAAPQASAVWPLRTADSIEHGTQQQDTSPLIAFAHLIIKIDHPHVAAVPIRTTASSRPSAHVTTEGVGQRAGLPPRNTSASAGSSRCLTTAPSSRNSRAT
jgi:hypothetical protein